MNLHKIFKLANVSSRLTLLIAAIPLALAPSSRAGLTGPYAVDGNTLHLWHLQETSGTICFDSVSNQNPQTFNFDMTNTPGPNASPDFDGIYATTNFTLQGQPGAILSYGYSNSITTAKYSCLYEPWQTFEPTNYNAYPANLACTNISNFVNTNTGAWTMEALIQPQVNLSTYSAESSQSLTGGDGPGNYLLPTRGWQWRINYDGGKPQLEFNDIMCPGTNHDLFAYLPTTGPDAITTSAPWQWYHVAVAWTGGAPTNGDAPHVLTVYWTSLDPTRTNGTADVLTNFPLAFTFTNKSSGGMLNWSANTLTTALYPSNSLHGTPFLTIGGNGRGTITNSVAGASGFLGNMEEVRISMSYRHANEFMFNTQPAHLPPTIGGPSTNNNLVAYGGILALTPSEGGTQPITNQWYQIVNGVTNLLADQTNIQLTISNVTFAANGYYQLMAANAYGETNSALAQVTVGAACEGLFNTGCGPQNNPLDQTAPGSVDQHWQLPLDPDTSGVIPNAIVWGDQAPVQPNGLVSANGASVTIGPRENASNKTGGTYTYQTTFQVDEADVTNTVISGNLLAPNGDNTFPLQMFVNGVETDFTLPANPTTTPLSFSITNGLQPGSNTLAFTLNYVSGNGYAGVTAFNCRIISDIGSTLTNAPVIANAPVSVTATYGSPVSFSAVALGAPPLSYQWLSNSLPITPPVWVGTTLPYLSFVATNFGLSQLTGTNYLANLQIVFSNYVGVVTSTVAQLTVTIPPLTVASAGIPIWNSTNSQTNIVVLFSATVDPVTAAVAGNYSLDNGASVLSATVLGTNEVMLGTSILTPGATYNLTVQNVKNSFGLIMSPSSPLAVGTYPSTVALWLKADTGVTTDANGVNQWVDLSGNGNNLSQPYGAPYEPQLATNAFGDPVIRFSATNETYMTASSSQSLAITGDMTILAVVNFATYAGNTNSMIVSKTYNQASPYDYYCWSNGARFLRGNGSASGVVVSSQAPSTGVPHVLDVTMQGINVTHRLDGKPNGSGTLSAAIADPAGEPLYIGTRMDGANRLTGDISELIVIGSALSPGDLASIERYLAVSHQVVTVNTNPTNLVASVSGNQLTLSWPADHTGWTLQAQTNSLSAGLGTNWVNVPNSTSINHVVVPIVSTNSSVFYRLFYSPN